MYQELSSQGASLLQEEGIILRKSLINYFDQLLNTVPYDITYNFDFDLISLIKALDVQTDVSSDTLIEQVLAEPLRRLRALLIHKGTKQ